MPDRKLVLALAGALWAGGAAAQSQSRAALDQMLAALKAAPTEQDAAVLEARITQMWLEAGTPAVTLLMSRGLRDLQAGADQEAEEDFDSVLALDPDLPAGYDRRAIARYQQGDVSGAIRDIEETLKREPRSFVALRDLAHIAEARKDWRGAYAAWQKVLEIDPKTPGGQDKLKDLQRRAFGEAT